MLDLTIEQIELAELIHAHVEAFKDDDASQEALIGTLPQYADAFFYLMENSTEIQRDYLCQQYTGLSRFTALMQILSEMHVMGELDVHLNLR